MTIKLSELSAPDMIEPLDYEEILQKKKDRLQELLPEFTALLESDPAIKILEVAAWDELLLRQCFNNVVRSNLLAFASGSGLDHLGVFSEVIRFDNEDDETYRLRIRAKNKGSSVAGTLAHYRYQALSADALVKDARTFSPEAGLVKIAVLSKEADGRPSDALLDKVRSHVTSENVRAVNDTVEVVPCDIVGVEIKAKIHLYPDTQPAIIDTIRQEFESAFEAQRRLGWDVTLSWIDAHLFAKGVHRIEIIEPSSDITIHNTAYATLKTLELEHASYDW